MALLNQAVGAASGAGSSVATDPQAHGSGRLLFAVVRSQDQDCTGLNDLAGNTWIPCPQVTGGGRLRAFYCTNPIAHAANVITATFASATTNRWIHVSEWFSSVPLRYVQSMEYAHGGGAALASRAFSTPDGSSRALVLAYSTQDDAHTIAAGSGYTLAANINSRGGLIYRETTSPLSLDEATVSSSSTQPGALGVVVFAAYPGVMPWPRGARVKAGTFGTTSTTPSFPEDPQDGDDILAFVAHTGGTSPVVSDSAGNSYTLLETIPCAAGGTMLVFRATDITGGPNFAVTVTFSNGPFHALVAYCLQYLGASNNDLVSQQETNVSTPSAGATVVPPSAHSIAFALCVEVSGGPDPDVLLPPAGWISGHSDRFDVGGSGEIFTEWQGVSSTFTGSFVATSPPIAAPTTAALSFAGTGPAADAPDPDDTDEAAFLDGTVSEPLTWLEVTDRNDDTRAYAEVDLNDPAAYFFGYKAPLVQRFLGITRGLSDRLGQLEHLSFGALFSDTSRFFRGLLASPATKYLMNRPLVERMIDDEDRRALGLPRVCAVGYVSDYSPRQNLQFEITGADWLKKKFSRKRRNQQSWQPLIRVEDFPNAAPEILDTPVPIIYGELSDKQESTEVIPADPGTPTVVGLRKPSNLTATVVGSAGSSSYSYGVTARDDQATSWSDHRGETDAAFVSVSNAPSLEQMSASRYVKLDWDPVPGAFRYRIYGRRSGGTVDLNALDSSGISEYHDGELHGRREVDVEKTFSHPPKQNNTVVEGDPGTPETTITTDTGSGVVPVIYTGLREIETGDEWHEFLVCGHALKSILAVYQDGVRIPDETLDDLFLIPGTAEWTAMFGSATYREFNGRRYTVLYAKQGGRGNRAAEGEEKLTLNVQGIEDVGDGSGDLIRSPVLQRLHFMNNWIAPDEPYATGPWKDASDTVFPHPELDNLPLVDEASHLAVELEMQARLSGGYETAGIIGASRSDFLSAIDALARFHVSGDFEQTFNRKGQDSVSMEPVSPPTGTRITDVLNVLDGSFEIRDDGQQAFFNILPYVDTPNYTDRELDSHQTQPGWFRLNEKRSQISIDLYDQERESPTWELHFGWSFTAQGLATINDVMGRKLARYRDPQRKVSMTGPFSFLNHEPGDVLRVKHFEGIGATGWDDRRIRVTRHEVEPTEGRVRIDAYDLDLILGAGFILGGEDIEDAWADADASDRQYGYLANDSDVFSDNEPAKVLR